MSELLKRPVFEVVGADPSGPDLSPAGEIVLSRMCRFVYGLIQRAPEDVLKQAAASGSDAAVMLALVTLASSDAAAEV